MARGLDPALLDLLRIIDECGGRISRMSYGGTEVLLREGYARRDGIDHLGRPMICMTDKGRDAITVVRESGEIVYSVKIDLQGVQAPVQQQFTLCDGMQVLHGLAVMKEWATVRPHTIGVEVLTSHHTVWLAYSPDQFIRCFSWHSHFSAASPADWDHTHLALCTACKGRNVEDAGKAGATPAIGCAVCNHTGRELHGINPVIKFV